MTAVDACSTCGGGSPLDAGPVCTCGTSWVPEEDPGPPDWTWLFHQLVVRSGQRCEARTPWCLGIASRGGSIAHLARSSVSIHHRRPRRKGGSRLADTHTMPNLMLLCGSGVTGCHGFIETYDRAGAIDRGILLHAGTVPANEPVTMPGGRVVWLDPSGLYVDVSDPPTFRHDLPDWRRAA